MQNKTVGEIVRKQETDFNSGKTTISKYVQQSLKADLDKIDAYSNSKHISGENDSLGRQKPFFNIVTAAMNIWYRATDIDRSNIRVRATKSSDHILGVLYNIHLQEWMKEAKFGVFLNQWGRTLSKYGSAILEFVEVDGELIPSVLDWNTIIVDSVRLDNAPLIKKLYLTPAQLRKNKNYDQKMVKALLDALTTRKNMDKMNKDVKADYIELYEVHGELSLANYKQGKGEKVKEGDEDEFFQQVHVISFIGAERASNKEFEDFTLYCGKEDNPHMITHLIEEDGYILANGAVKSLFQAQQWTNHNQKAIKDYLDFTSKLLLQTADEAYLGRNSYSHFELGDVLVTKPNMPFSPVQFGNNSGAISELRADKQGWQSQGMEVTSTPDAIRGNTMPSGTPAILAEQLAQQSSSLFEIMTENKGLYIEEMMTRFIDPYLMKKMDTSEEIMATLDNAGIKEIDEMYVPNEAIRRYNEATAETILNSNPLDPNSPQPSPYQPDIAEAQVRNELKPLGNKRSFKPSEVSDKTWKELFKGFKKRYEVEVTGEMHNKATLLSDYNATLANLVQLGDVQNARLVLGKIMEEMGNISPTELSQIQNAPQPLVGGSSGGLPVQ